MGESNVEDDVTVSDLDEIEAPWGKKIRMQNLRFEEGMSLLRLRIREGRRITDLELDPDTARRVAAFLSEWADGNG